MTTRRNAVEKNLSVRERKFVKAYIANGGNGVKASLSAGLTKNYGVGNNIANALTNSPRVQKALVVEMEKQGITDELLAKKLREGLDAGEHRAMKIGKKLRFVDSPDFGTRVKYLDLTHKIRGDFAPEKVDARVQDAMIIIERPGMKK